MSKKKAARRRSRNTRAAQPKLRPSLSEPSALAVTAPTSPLQSPLQLIRQRKFAEAKRTLERQLKRGAADPQNLSALSLAYLGCRQFDDAAKTIGRAVADGLVQAADQLGFGAEAFRAGDFELAEHSFALAARIQPDAFEPHLNLGMAAHSNERLEAAVDAYDKALVIRPDLVSALQNRGVALKCLGRLEEAARSLEQAFALQPDNVEVLCNLGQVAERGGQPAQAKHWFQLAQQNDPANADIQYCLGNLCLAEKQFKEAAAHYYRSLEARPDNAYALNNLGGALVMLRSDREAKRCFEQALSLDPQHANALENLGDLHARLGDAEDALACFEKALTVEPQILSATVKKGRALRRLKRPEDAESAFQAAIQLDPASADALSELGMIAFHRGEHEQSVAFLRQACEAEPANPLYPYLEASSLPVVYESNDHIGRVRDELSGRVDALLDSGQRLDPRSHSPNTFFYLAYHGRNDIQLQSRIGEAWKPCDACQPRADGRERIRVGFLTRYLTDHTIGMLTGGLIAKLNREQFETVTLAFDGNHPWFRETCDQFHVTPQRPGELIDYVGRLNLDILVFPEVGMDALTNAVARARMAPVQCAMWGHPVTTGIPTIDYFISSKLLEHERSPQHYTEKLALLDTLPAYYFRPKFDETFKCREQLGLSASATLYACPQSLFKFHPDFDAVLDSVLRQDPNGRLVLIEGGDPNWTQLLKARFAKNIESHDRIDWLPRLDGKDFFALLNEADVVLDPMHFGGGRSSYLTMAAGTPLVTMPAEYMRGRAAAAMYEMLGYRECVVATPEAYVAKAVELGADRDYRTAVGAEIQARSEVLFEDDGAVAALERFLADAHQGAVPASA